MPVITVNKQNEVLDAITAPNGSREKVHLKFPKNTRSAGRTLEITGDGSWKYSLTASGNQITYGTDPFRLQVNTMREFVFYVEGDGAARTLSVLVAE